MFIVVRSKKADLRPLSPYYYLESPSSISEKSLQTNAQSYLSKARNNIQSFDPFYSAHHLVFIGQGVVVISPESRDIYVQEVNT